MNKVIIISGKSGAGKDMIGHFMKEELEKHHQRVLVIHYADAVKWVLRDYFNWDGKKDERGRTLLQHIGTDVVRAKYPNFWVNIVADLISAFEDEFDVAIIPDARFENEVQIVMEKFPALTCIRIERTNADGTAWVNPAFTPEQLIHPSETSLDDFSFNYIVHNDAGLEELKDSAVAILEDLNLIEKE